MKLTGSGKQESFKKKLQALVITRGDCCTGRVPRILEFLGIIR